MHSLQETCKNLFGGYPLAVEDVSGDGEVRSIALILEDHGEPEFFNLCWWPGNARGEFMLDCWCAGQVADGEVVAILARAVPLPCDGSLFGWVDHGEVSALISVRTEYDPAHQVPGWSLLPRTDAAQWPPFAGEHLFGRWFWDHYRAGRIVDLAGLVEASPASVFWVLPAGAGAGCYAVARSLTSPGGWSLPQGRYVYHKPLSSGEPVPSLGDLLADPSAADLAPLFASGRPAGAS